MDASVKQVPQFGPLIPGIPLSTAVPERENPFLGAGAFFIPPGATDGGVEPARAQPVEQRLCFESTAAPLRSPGERICAVGQGVPILMHD